MTDERDWFDRLTVPVEWWIAMPAPLAYLLLLPLGAYLVAVMCLIGAAVLAPWAALVWLLAALT